VGSALRQFAKRLEADPQLARHLKEVGAQLQNQEGVLPKECFLR
jgi:hypothetical protein